VIAFGVCCCWAGTVGGEMVSQGSMGNERGRRGGNGESCWSTRKLGMQSMAKKKKEKN